MPKKIPESAKRALSEESQNKIQNSSKRIAKEYREKYSKKYSQVRQSIQKLIQNGQKEAFYMFDAKSADERIALWREFLPRVELFYAVKTNPNQKILDQCLKNQTGYDVASGNEINKVMAMGGRPEDCIFASPIKKVDDLLIAKKFGIKMMTFDCSEELYKISKHFPQAECILRIATEKTTALYNLSEKFGAFMTEVPQLLQTAKDLGLRIKGVAFHTGSGGVTFTSYDESLLNTRKVFDQALQLGMPPLEIVDIGGGFTMVSPEQEKNFDFVAPLISEAINNHFPEDTVRFIAEPGRFVSESVVYHAATIIGTKQLESGHRHYYLDSGIFQAYGLRPYGEEAFIDPVDKKIEGREKVLTTWWGQTCDSCDWIIKDKLQPFQKTGEWVVTKDHGAYNMALGNTFNGYETPKIIYI